MTDEIHATARAFDVLDIPYRQRDKGGEPLLARISATWPPTHAWEGVPAHDEVASDITTVAGPIVTG